MNGCTIRYNSPELTSSFHSPLAVILLTALVLLTCVQSIVHGFVWDDYGLIVDNQFIINPTGWLDLFTRNFWEITDASQPHSRNFYRPLITLSYMLDHVVSGPDPAWYHVMNILLHLGCVWSVYALAIQFKAERFQAFFAAALFAVLPVHVENVYWISGRTDLLCTLFYLTAFRCYILYTTAENRRSSFYFAVLLSSFLLSLFSKEMAVSFPLILFVYHILFERSVDLRNRFRTALLSVLLLTTIYFYIRYFALGRVLGIAGSASLYERALTIPVIVSQYVLLLTGITVIDPHHITGMHETILSPWVWAAFGFCLLLLAAFIRACHQRNRTTAFFIAWFVLTLLPVLHLSGFGDILIADRFLYLPSVAYVFLLTTGLTHIENGKFLQRANRRVRIYLPRTLAILYILVLTGTANLYGTIWRSDERLFAHAIRTSPDSAYIYNNFASSLARNGHHRDALKVYQTALMLLPSYGSVYMKAGFSMRMIGRHEEAIPLFMNARKYGAHSTMLYNNLGYCLRHLNHINRAEQSYRISIRLNDNAAARNNLAEILMTQQRVEQAEIQLRRSLQLEPTLEAYNNLALCRMHTGDNAAALRLLHHALRLTSDTTPAPVNGVLHANLARVLAENNRLADASQSARIAQNISMEMGAPLLLDPATQTIMNELLEDRKEL